MAFGTLLTTALLLTFASAQQIAYGQCGGKTWQGATTCIPGWVCTYGNDFYSQCLPGGSTITTVSTTVKTSTTSAATTKTSATGNQTTRSSTSTTSSRSSTSSTGNATSRTSTTRSTTTSATATGGGSDPGATLQPGYYWIRAVEAPNFHKYLQTSPTGLPGTAILADYTTAGQFAITNGQLVQLVAGGGLLYANVAVRNGSERTLAVSFSKTQNAYGTFAFSGDALVWTVDSIARPNTAAWYVCAAQQLFINLGAYLYDTPAGCADETVHYYNGATAVA